MRTANETCEKKCSPCPNCYDLTIYRIRDILYAIKQKIVEYSEFIVCKANWGYSCKSNLKEEDYNKLLLYKDSLETYYKSLLDGYDDCLCPEEIQSIVEKVLDIVDLSCVNSTIRNNMSMDESKLDLWVLENPSCVAYFEWEKHLINACPLIGITVKPVEDPCKLITKINIVEKKCKLLTTASVYQKACEVGAEVKITPKQCKINYNILVNKNECNLKYDTYVKLLECNMTPEIITSFIECGVEVDYNVTKKCPELKINADTSLLLCDLNVNVFAESVDEYILSQYSGDELEPYEVDKLIDSYIDSCEIIKKEINGI